MSDSTPPDAPSPEGAAEKTPPPRRRRRRRAPKASPVPAASLEGAHEVARRWFGVRRMHPEQESAIEAVLAEKDTLVVLPTGMGKSLIYQVPALLMDRPVLVVSPLIALMRDQELGLQKRRVPVVRLDSTLKKAARDQALNRISKGGRLIILTTPETLESQAVRPYFEAAKPALLCVDEAHCISEWGHDFRPAYLRLGAERRALGIPHVLALTATATPRVAEDIAVRLDMEAPHIIRSAPHRDNLRLEVKEAGGNKKIEVTGRLLRRLKRPGIVYCATTKAVDEIFVALSKARIPVARYHGKMPTAERTAAQKRFMRANSRVVMVATSAFGMGVDKPDIRFILHFQVPGSLEQYVQEAGRAGRDGRLARCVLLFDPADLETQRYLMRSGRPSPSALRRVGEALTAWAAEGRGVNTKDLALSAGTTQIAARSFCAELETLGLVELGDKREWTSTGSPEDLERGVEDLARRFETLRREDEKRLQRMEDYARAPKECRSVLIRTYFGEEDPPRCGICDRCKAEEEIEASLERASAAADRAVRGEEEPEPEEGAPQAKKKRRRRRSRSKKRPAEGGAPRPEAAPKGEGQPAGKKKRRRRRRRRGGGQGGGAGPGGGGPPNDGG